MADYITTENDRLDKIAKKVYGTEREGLTEKILMANRGLAARGSRYPIGVELTIPTLEFKPPSDRGRLELWD